MAIPLDQELGSATAFEVLGSTAVTGEAGVGTSVIGGSVGIYPAAVTFITNFPPSTVTGGTIQGPSGVTLAARNDATAAYNNFQSLAGGTTVVGNLNGQVLTPGIYKSASSMDLAVGGVLTLNGGGDPNSTFIFQIGSTLTINNGSSVVLINGASAKNIIWAVGSSATIGTTATMQGDVIASASITQNAGANTVGRLIALNGAVTFSGTTGNTATSPEQVTNPGLAVGQTSVPATITLSELCFPDITGKTIQAWGLVSITPGGYTLGGIPFGLLLFADQRTVDFNGFLRCEVYGEEVVTNLVGNYQYHYSPVNDGLQIFTATGVELASGQAIPLAVLEDVLLFKATWNRTTVLG